MDVRAITEKADSLFPNVYSFSKKAAWLYELDCRIYKDFLCAYGAGDSVSTQDGNSPDRQLLLDDSFSDVYLYYLFMQLELNSGNITGYQNQAALFNSSYLSFMSCYNRNHLIAARRINIE